MATRGVVWPATRRAGWGWSNSEEKGAKWLAKNPRLRGPPTGPRTSAALQECVRVAFVDV
eukprot:3281110-Prymnesium_polylepis.1